MTIFTFLFLSIFNCGQVNTLAYKKVNGDTIHGDNKHISADKKLQEKIIDTIFNLPEVIKDQNYVQAKTNGKRHLGVRIYQSPKESGKKYYWVKVVEDNGTAFFSHFNFYVYPDPFIIKYVDTIKDRAMILSEWRRSSKKGRSLPQETIKS